MTAEAAEAAEAAEERLGEQLVDGGVVAAHRNGHVNVGQG